MFAEVRFNMEVALCDFLGAQNRLETAYLGVRINWCAVKIILLHCRCY